MLSSFHYFTLVSSYALQAEHGPDSQVVLVAVSEEVDIAAIEREVEKQCRELPRDNIASEALSHSYIVVVKDMAEVMLTSELSHNCRASMNTLEISIANAEPLPFPFCAGLKL